MKNILLVFSILCSFVFFGCSVQGPENPAGPAPVADDLYDGEMSPLSLTMSNFGIYSDSFPLSVRWGFDTVTNFMTNSASRLVMVGITNQCGEGNHAWEFVGTGTLMGMTVNVNPVTALKDMRFYTNGSLKFMYRGTKGIRVGIRSGGASPVSKLIQMTNGRFGFYTNNSWCIVTIPLSLFSGVDLSKIEWYFMALVDDLVSPLPSPSTPISPLFSQLTVFFLDNIYWTAPAPPEVIDTNGTFGIYGETIPQNLAWNVDYRWFVSDYTSVVAEQTSIVGEGTKAIKVTGGYSGWLGINMNKLPAYTYHDLRAYTNGNLRFMIKTSKPVWIGMQTGTGTQTWLVMTNGIYGFYTNNQWCSVTIPMSVYTSQGANMGLVSQYFKVFAGTPENFVTGDIFYLDRIFLSPAPVPPVVIDTNKAFVLYSDTMRQNVTWGVDINTNESPSDPNQLSFTNNTAGEGPNSLRIKVNSNMFNVNLLRFPLVTYLDLSAYANGSLRFMVKATKGISVSIHMAENYDIMEHLSNGNYGFYTNNTWCSVVIPMSNYIKRGLNLTSLYGWLKFYGGYYEGVTGGEEYYLDNVYFYKQ